MDNDATAEQWALFSPPDEFDVADAKWIPDARMCVAGVKGRCGGDARREN
jgi:hypothetical protein